MMMKMKREKPMKTYLVMDTDNLSNPTFAKILADLQYGDNEKYMTRGAPKQILHVGIPITIDGHYGICAILKRPVLVIPPQFAGFPISNVIVCEEAPASAYPHAKPGHWEINRVVVIVTIFEANGIPMLRATAMADSVANIYRVMMSIIAPKS